MDRDGGQQLVQVVHARTEDKRVATAAADAKRLDIGIANAGAAESHGTAGHVDGSPRRGGNTQVVRVALSVDLGDAAPAAEAAPTADAEAAADSE